MTDGGCVTAVLAWTLAPAFALTSTGSGLGTACQLLILSITIVKKRFGSDSVQLQVAALFRYFIASASAASATQLKL